MKSLSTAVERVCWLPRVAEVRVASLCFIYSSLLALLWVCKSCSSKVLVLNGTQCLICMWIVVLSLRSLPGKVCKSWAIVFGEHYWWGKRIPGLLDAETASPNINWLSAHFPDSVDRQLIMFEKQAPEGIYGIGEKAPIMMCDRAAIKMIAGFSESARSSYRVG